VPSYARRLRRPAETQFSGAHDDSVKSGITTVSSSLLCILAAVNAGTSAPSLDLPRGYTASVYASGLDGASRLDVEADGTLRLDLAHERIEIAPPTADAPVTVMRVAAELENTATAEATLAIQTPRLVRMRWDAQSGELAFVIARDDGVGAGVSIAPQTLALARVLARRHHADVALAPDGALYFADSRVGAVWRIERKTL
jgi:hypothetical protein